MSNDHYSDSGDVKGQARQEAGEVRDHAVQQAGEVRDHATQEAGAVKGHATQEAGAVKDHAVTAARDVANTAQTEAQSVARDAQTEFRGLVDSGLNELNTQMGGGQTRLAAELRNVVDELGEMVQGSQHDGLATQFARELNQRGDGLVSWLDSHEPRDAVTEVRRYAARNPWTFLAIAAGAGLLVGRFARGVRDDNADDQIDYRNQAYGQATYGYTGQTHIGTGYDDTAARGVYGEDARAMGYSGTQSYGTGDVTAAPNTGFDSGAGTRSGLDSQGYTEGETAQGYNAQFGDGTFGTPGERR